MEGVTDAPFQFYRETQLHMNNMISAAGVAFLISAMSCVKVRIDSKNRSRKAEWENISGEKYSMIGNGIYRIFFRKYNHTNNRYSQCTMQKGLFQYSNRH